MNRQTVTSICEQVYSRYPEVSGVRPKVQERPGDQVLLIFSGRSKLADGRSVTRTVRIVADANGRILKATASK